MPISAIEIDIPARDLAAAAKTQWRACQGPLWLLVRDLGTEPEAELFAKRLLWLLRARPVPQRTALFSGLPETAFRERYPGVCELASGSGFPIAVVCAGRVVGVPGVETQGEEAA